MREIYELTDDDTGDYRLDTASGTSYALDLNPPFRTLRRLPRQNEPTQEFSDLTRQQPLRRDGDALPLLQIVRVKVGERASFFVLVRTDGILTWRGTTPIVRIVELEGPEPAHS